MPTDAVRRTTVGETEEFFNIRVRHMILDEDREKNSKLTPDGHRAHNDRALLIAMVEKRNRAIAPLVTRDMMEDDRGAPHCGSASPPTSP